VQYGAITLDAIDGQLQSLGKELGVLVESFRTNSEAAMCERILRNSESFFRSGYRKAICGPRFGIDRNSPIYDLLPWFEAYATTVRKKGREQTAVSGLAQHRKGLEDEAYHLAASR
jgi:hypothetical protein